MVLMNKYTFLVWLLMVPAMLGAQQVTEPLLPYSPLVILGMGPGEAIEQLGPPVRVFPVRGPEAWQDDVVFDYGDGFSVYLFMDRVWQVRLARPYPIPVAGFILGQALSQAIDTFGQPTHTEPSVAEWLLPGQAWPIRLRAFIEADGTIQELYVYRADF
jgi:hypothetical protein